MLQRIRFRRPTRSMILVLTPAVLLLAFILKLHFDVVNAEEPGLVVHATAAQDWKMQYLFSELYPSTYNVLTGEKMYMDAVTAGSIADAALSRYRGDWTIITHPADWLGFGRLTLPDGRQPLVWRYAMDGAVVDVNATTGSVLLLVDGGTFGNTQDVCLKAGDSSSPDFMSRCLSQTVHNYLQPYTLLVTYLIVVGLIMLGTTLSRRLHQDRKIKVLPADAP